MLTDGPLLRRRKQTVHEVIEEFDAFTKVRDEVKQDKHAFGGLVTIVSLIIIALLVVVEFRNYWFGNDEFVYKFSVDATYDEYTELELDMIVATPCSNLMSQISGGSSRDPTALHRLKKDPTRFEFTEKEALYWNELKKTHEHINGTFPTFQSLEQMTFISNRVEEGLKAEADAKQHEEVYSLREKGKQKRLDSADGGGALLIIGDGFNVFHIMSSNLDKNEGSACRIHGSMSVSRVKSTSIILTAVRGFEFGGMLAHFDGISQRSNLSHRIGYFSFGPKIYGLVTPLTGAEQISAAGTDEYRYFVKVIPTRIHHSGIFGGSTLSYQYSVTFMQKALKNSTQKHDAIVINCEFAPTVIEVNPVQISLLQLLIRVCSAVGGIFATSAILNGLCMRLSSFWISAAISRDQARLKLIAPVDFNREPQLIHA